MSQYSYWSLSTTTYNHVMGLSSDFHDSKESGSMWQSMFLGHSVTNLLNMLLFELAPMLVDLVVAVGYLYYLFDAYMALIIATVAITYLWATAKLTAKQTALRREYNEANYKEYNVMCESTSNWQTVSYFNRIPFEQQKYSCTVEGHMRAQKAYSLARYFETAVQASIISIGLLWACYLAAYQVAHGQKSVGNFVTFLSYWAQLSGPISFFAKAYIRIARDLIDAERLLRLLEKTPAIANRSDAKPLALTAGEVKFENVNFSYDEKRQILKSVTFEVKPGQTIALVGETGGGKSTILKLLARFYDCQSGVISIDGQNIKDVTFESLRECIGNVPQDPALFNDTVFNNVRYAKLDATEEEVHNACKAAAIHDKIMTFAEKYKTKVGERGVKLSGGELQRIAIARAILKDSKLVFLDEATSAVDTETEIEIQQSLSKLTADRTTFVIAHRLSTIISASKILVIKGGEIVEQGTHSELLRNKGKYHDLWSKQITSKASDEKVIVDDLKTDVQAGKTEDTLGAEQPAKTELVGRLEDEPKKATTPAPIASPKKEHWKPDAPEFIPSSTPLGKTPSRPSSPEKLSRSHDRAHESQIASLKNGSPPKYEPRNQVGGQRLKKQVGNTPSTPRPESSTGPAKEPSGAAQRPRSRNGTIVQQSNLKHPDQKPQQKIENRNQLDGVAEAEEVVYATPRSKPARQNRRQQSKSEPSTQTGESNNEAANAFGAKQTAKLPEHNTLPRSGSQNLTKPDESAGTKTRNRRRKNWKIKERTTSTSTTPNTESANTTGSDSYNEVSAKPSVGLAKRN